MVVAKMSMRISLAGSPGTTPGYVQDDWKVSRNLTLNLGLNYSVDVPRREAINYTSHFSYTATDPEYGVPGALIFGTTCTGCNTKWADTYFKDFAPRVGFAYTPPWLTGKTVVRGGAGILYGPLQYDDFGGSMNSGYKSNPSFNSNNGFDPSFVIDSGYPAFPAPPEPRSRTVQRPARFRIVHRRRKRAVRRKSTTTTCKCSKSSPRTSSSASAMWAARRKTSRRTTRTSTTFPIRTSLLAICSVRTLPIIHME